MIAPGVSAAVRGWLQSGEPLELIVTTGSMAPSILPGETVRVEAITSQRLSPGMILLLDVNGRYVAHRLIWRDRLLWTRGDASPRFDPPLRPAGAIGRIVAVERDGRWLPLPATPGVPRRLIPPLLQAILRYYAGALLRRLGARQ